MHLKQFGNCSCLKSFQHHSYAPIQDNPTNPMTHGIVSESPRLANEIRMSAEFPAFLTQRDVPPDSYSNQIPANNKM